MKRTMTGILTGVLLLSGCASTENSAPATSLPPASQAAPDKSIPPWEPTAPLGKEVTEKVDAWVKEALTGPVTLKIGNYSLRTDQQGVTQILTGSATIICKTGEAGAECSKKTPGGAWMRGEPLKEDVSKTVTNLTLKQMPLLVKLLELPINTKSTPGVYTQTGGKLTVRAAIPGETTGRLAAETSTVTPSVTLEVTGTELTLTTVKAEGSEKLTLTKNPDSESLIPSN